MNDASHEVLVILLLAQCESYDALQSRKRLHYVSCAARCYRVGLKPSGLDRAGAIFSLIASLVFRLLHALT